MVKPMLKPMADSEDTRQPTVYRNLENTEYLVNLNGPMTRLRRKRIFGQGKPLKEVIYTTK